MRACLRSAVVLALVTAAAVFPQPGGLMERAQSQQPGAIIQPDVLDALHEDSEVAVLISLPLPPAPLADVSLAEMQQNTSQPVARRPGLTSRVAGCSLCPYREP